MSYAQSTTPPIPNARMKLSQVAMLSLQALISLASLTSGSLITVSGNLSLPDVPTPILGSLYNHWVPLGNKTFDLTRSLYLQTTTPLTIPMTGSRRSAVIEPSRSALVIIDMQNYFLHPELSPRAEEGRKAVDPTLKMIDGFRKRGMKVLWTNWGLDGRDLLQMPASFLAGFSGGSDSPLSIAHLRMGKVWCTNLC